MFCALTLVLGKSNDTCTVQDPTFEGESHLPIATRRLGLQKRKPCLTLSVPKGVNTTDTSSCQRRVPKCFQFRLLPLYSTAGFSSNPKTPSGQQKRRRRGGQELTNPLREAPLPPIDGMGGIGASPCDLDGKFAPQIAQLLATPSLQSAQVLPSGGHPPLGY